MYLLMVIVYLLLFTTSCVWSKRLAPDATARLKRGSSHPMEKERNCTDSPTEETIGEANATSDSSNQSSVQSPATAGLCVCAWKPTGLTSPEMTFQFTHLTECKQKCLGACWKLQKSIKVRSIQDWEFSVTAPHCLHRPLPAYKWDWLPVQFPLPQFTVSAASPMRTEFSAVPRVACGSQTPLDITVTGTCVCFDENLETSFHEAKKFDDLDACRTGCQAHCQQLSKCYIQGPSVWLTQQSMPSHLNSAKRPLADRKVLPKPKVQKEEQQEQRSIVPWQQDQRKVDSMLCVADDGWAKPLIQAECRCYSDVKTRKGKVAVRRGFNDVSYYPDMNSCMPSCQDGDGYNRNVIVDSLDELPSCFQGSCFERCLEQFKESWKRPLFTMSSNSDTDKGGDFRGAECMSIVDPYWISNDYSPHAHMTLMAQAAENTATHGHVIRIGTYAPEFHIAGYMSFFGSNPLAVPVEASPWSINM